MPTTIDRFFGVVQLCQNLATMQNNMRANVQNVKADKDAGRLVGDPPHVMTFADAQAAMRGMGTAFLQRLDMNAAVVTQYPGEVQAGAVALGIAYADMTAVYANLRTWATNLSTATITNQTQLDNGVAAVLANVPASMLPF